MADIKKEYHLTEPPEKASMSNITARMVDGAIFRFEHAMDGINESSKTYDPGHESMDMLKMMNHIYQLSFWMHNTFDRSVEFNRELTTFDEYQAKILGHLNTTSELLKSLADEELASTEIYLHRVKKKFPFWYIYNGPLADILTHIGQILTWRRMNENPVPKVSPFMGE